MRGVFCVAAALAGAASTSASIGWDFTDTSDTTVNVGNFSGGKSLVATSGSGSNAVAVTATGGTAIRAEGVNVHDGAGTGVYATGPRYGVRAFADGTEGVAVSGTGPGDGVGLLGAGYYGVYATGAYRGVYGESNQENGKGVHGLATGFNGAGVHGVATDGNAPGVWGQSVYSPGVRGESDSWTGVYGSGPTGVQGDGFGDYSVGVFGWASGVDSYAGIFNGNVAVWGDCDPCSPSDSRFKKNVQPLSDGLKKIMSLKPKTYEMKTEEFKSVNFSKGTKYGLMAEDLAQVMPEIVHTLRTPPTKDEKGQPVKGAVGEDYKAVAYSRLIPVLISAIQELQAEVDALKKAR